MKEALFLVILFLALTMLGSNLGSVYHLFLLL